MRGIQCVHTLACEKVGDPAQQEERDRVLAETAAKRLEGAEPPSAPPPSNLPPEVDRGLTLSPDAIEARLSAPVAPSPPRSPRSSPLSPRGTSRSTPPRGFSEAW